MKLSAQSEWTTVWLTAVCILSSSISEWQRMWNNLLNQGRSARRANAYPWTDISEARLNRLNYDKMFIFVSRRQLKWRPDSKDPIHTRCSRAISSAGQHKKMMPCKAKWTGSNLSVLFDLKNKWVWTLEEVIIHRATAYPLYRASLESWMYVTSQAQEQATSPIFSSDIRASIPTWMKLSKLISLSSLVG